MPEVLAMRYDWQGTSLVTLHNFAATKVTAVFDLKVPRADRLVDVFSENHSDGRSGRHAIDLEPYAWRWLRVGSPDNALYREPR